MFGSGKIRSETNMKEVCLEMGGKSATVVLESATANSHIIAHKSVYDDLVAELIKQAGSA